MFSMNTQALELYVKAAKEDGDADGGYRVSLMALKCLNNAIWDQPAGQTAFVRLGGLDMLVGLLKVTFVLARRHFGPGLVLTLMLWSGLLTFCSDLLTLLPGQMLIHINSASCC